MSDKTKSILWTPEHDGLFDMPWERYQTASAANCSGCFFPTAAHMRQYTNDLIDQLLGVKPMKSKPAYTVGTLTHKFLIEPDVAFDGLKIQPEETRGQTKDAKEQRRKWQGRVLGVELEECLTADEFTDRALRAGATVISQEEFDVIQGMVNSVLLKRCTMRSGNSIVFDGPLDELIGLAKCEQAAFAKRDLIGTEGPEPVRTKARVDMNVMGNIVLDIKTTAGEAILDDFAKSMWNFRYDARAAFNLDILNALEPITGQRKDIFMPIVVEKKPPHAVAVFQIEPRAIEAGRLYYQERLRVWAKAQKTQEWPGYTSEVQSLGLPEWAYRKTGT